MGTVVTKIMPRLFFFDSEIFRKEHKVLSIIVYEEYCIIFILVYTPTEKHSRALTTYVMHPGYYKLINIRNYRVDHLI